MRRVHWFNHQRAQGSIHNLTRVKIEQGHYDAGDRVHRTISDTARNVQPFRGIHGGYPSAGHARLVQHRITKRPAPA